MILIGALTYRYDEQGNLLKRRGKGLIKTFPDKDGYLKYHLGQNGKTHNVFVHRVVWTIFKGDIPDGLTVDHINNNRRDNRIENLQLLTAEENAVKGNARRWHVVTPEGYDYVIYNLEAYCREMGLNASHMREVARGYKNQTHCKGYKCYELD